MKKLYASTTNGEEKLKKELKTTKTLLTKAKNSYKAQQIDLKRAVAANKKLENELKQLREELKKKPK